MHRLFVVCAPGLTKVLSGEMGAPATAGGVEIEGDLREAARLNLTLRTATRVLLRLGELRATTFAELVKKAQKLPFDLCLRKGDPVALRVACHKSRLYHSGAVAQRLREAIGERLGKPPPEATANEDEADPPQLLLARFDRDVCTVSADTSGALLHRRGYRLSQAHAPLRETLAAAMLLAAGYDGSAPVLDPLCGSGTIAIEAALIARRRAPGIARSFALERWPGFDAAMLGKLRDEARAREIEKEPHPVAASDADPAAVRAARENAKRAGVDLRIEERPLREVRLDPGAGLIVTNPPYGVRVSADLIRLYSELGDLVRRSGYRLAVLAADRRTAAASKLRLETAFRTQNGGIGVELLIATR
ncbi:MAG: class I SAM-dependent RNA methyltransferase [Myxococcales bacterium]